jgi:hypothetical protein
MTSTVKVLGSSPSRFEARDSLRQRWQALRDLLGGALLLAAWLALWTVTWAAVAGPLAPSDAARADALATITQGG